MGHVQCTDINRNGHQTDKNIIDSHPVDLSSPKPQNRFGHSVNYHNVRENSSSSYLTYNNRQSSTNYENGMDTSQADFSSKCGNIIILFEILFSTFILQESLIKTGLDMKISVTHRN